MPDINPICPRCLSPRIVLPPLEHAEAAVCLDCARLFIPETRPDPAAQLCDDCAFRPGSPERVDPYKWAEIIQTTIVDAAHPFYCHKGMGCELRGQTLHYLMPTEGEKVMTPCAGWRAHKLAYEAGTPAREL